MKYVFLFNIIALFYGNNANEVGNHCLKEDVECQSRTNIWQKNDEKGPKELNILSLDGGGSRGIMESIMLGHIMNLASIMKENPSCIKEVIKTNDWSEISPLISSHPNPIHPTEVFDYIVGKFDFTYQFLITSILNHFIKPRPFTLFCRSIWQTWRFLGALLLNL